MTFEQLAQSVHASHTRYDRDADLPTPNVYWSTVSLNDGRVHNGYVAADHTLPAMRKVVLEAQDKLHVRLHRANSVIKLRRLKLGDLLEAPEAFQQALEAAKGRSEWDIVRALESLPERLAASLKLTIDHDAAWAQLCSEINQVQLQYA